MSQAAYVKKVTVSANGSDWYEVPATSATLNNGAEPLDDTNMDTNAGYRTRLLGLLDWSVNLDIVWQASNTALSTILTAMTGRSALQVRYMPNGTSGFVGAVVVESYNSAGDVGGLETTSVTLQANGALAAYTPA